MEMMQVMDGVITQYRLPHVGRLSDGSMVSGYHLLSPAVLRSEGWLPLEEEDIPEYNHETEYIQPKYTIQVDQVIKGFDVKKIPTDPVRLALQKLIKLTDLTPEEIEIMVDIYDPYEVGKNYIPGTVFKHLGKLYKVIQAHTSQSNWKPDGEGMTAIYLSWMPENIVADWELKPSHNTYKVGDVVKYKGELWICKEPNLVVAPDGDAPWNRYWEPYVG